MTLSLVAAGRRHNGEVVLRTHQRYHGSVTGERGSTLIVVGPDPRIADRFVLADPDYPEFVLRRVRRESFTAGGLFVDLRAERFHESRRRGCWPAYGDARFR